MCRATFNERIVDEYYETPKTYHISVTIFVFEQKYLCFSLQSIQVFCKILTNKNTFGDKLTRNHNFETIIFNFKKRCLRGF